VVQALDFDAPPESKSLKHGAHRAHGEEPESFLGFSFVFFVSFVFQSPLPSVVKSAAFARSLQGR